MKNVRSEGAVVSMQGTVGALLRFKMQTEARG